MSINDITKYLLPNYDSRDFNTFDFKNHADVKKWAESTSKFVPNNYNLYKSVRMQYKVFCFWLSDNKYPCGTLRITSFTKSGSGHPTLDHKKGSPSHDGGHAFDISGSKPEILLFYMFLLMRIKHLGFFAISEHNWHIHVDTMVERKNKANIEICKPSGEYGFKKFLLEDLDRLGKFYGWGVSEKRLLKYMDHDTTASDLIKEASDGLGLPSLGKYFLMFFVFIFVIMGLKK